MKVEWSLARNSTAKAISSGRPRRGQECGWTHEQARPRPPHGRPHLSGFARRHGIADHEVGRVVRGDLPGHVVDRRFGGAVAQVSGRGDQAVLGRQVDKPAAHLIDGGCFTI